MRTVCDAYGLAGRHRLVDTVLCRQDRCRRGIESRAGAGDPAVTTLRDGGTAESVRTAYRWVSGHRDRLRAALRQGHGAFSTGRYLN